MTGRIRGHYRIDSTGHVQPLGDVNGLAKPYTIPLSVLQNQPCYRRARLRRITTAGTGAFVLGLLLLSLMPQIERAVLSAQSARLAQARAIYIQDHPPLQMALSKHR